MAYELEGLTLRPISSLITESDFPLADLLPSDRIAEWLEGIYYTQEISTWAEGQAMVRCRLAIETELSMKLPGLDSVSIVLGSGGEGWTTFQARLSIGLETSFEIQEAEIGLRVDPSILKDQRSGGPAEIFARGTLHVGQGGLAISGFDSLSLAPSYVCGTGLLVEAQEVTPIFGDPALARSFGEPSDFEGVALRKLAVTFPPEWLEAEPGSSGLKIEFDQARIGSTGLSCSAKLASADMTAPLTGKLFGFPFRFKGFELEVEHNSILSARLDAEVRIEALESGEAEKWIAIEVEFLADGGFSATLSVAQPPGASTVPADPVTFEREQAFRLGVRSVRAERAPDGVFALYFSGYLKLLVEGAEWPEVGFDEVGVDSRGNLLLPEGDGIAFATPLVAKWHFTQLTISKFALGRPPGRPERLRIALSASVTLLQGVPSGASLRGLTIEWDRRDSSPPEIGLEGIGVKFGVSGSFNAGLELSYRNVAGKVEFRGQGKLDLTALDASIDVGAVIGWSPEGFAFLYLFADAKLLPSGIPIGSTGVSIYGFQGLLAYNMALDLNRSLPEDERYYEIFARPPGVGITDSSKWVDRQGQNALGAGIVIGTADKGFCVNAKGLIAVAFPDLTVLLQARANILKKKPDVDGGDQGSLSALMVYSQGQSSLSLDIVADWSMPKLVAIQGQARAFFSFRDAGAWYFEMGRDQDGKRVSARVFDVNGSWLFNAGSWFRIDRNGIVTGVVIDVKLKHESGGFWVEASGHARGAMAIHFDPWQWEGSLELWGSVSAGYRGISIGIKLEGIAEARVADPLLVHIGVEACVSALFWEICRRVDFEWKKESIPALAPALKRSAAKPRHWTAHERGDRQLDSGTVALPLSGRDEIAIHPHSVLSLDFGRPVVDGLPGLFNEAVSLEDGGFRTVGGSSGWAEAYVLERLELVADPDGAAAPVALWGTWSRSTLEPNTSLQLMSSERFTHDGSRTCSFVNGKTLDYCARPEDTRRCVGFAGAKPGYGRLDDGTLYHWEGDRIEILPPRPLADPSLEAEPGRATVGEPGLPSKAPSLPARLCPWLLKYSCFLRWLALGLAFAVAVSAYAGKAPSLALTLLLLLVLALLVVSCWIGCEREPSGSLGGDGAEGPGPGDPSAPERVSVPLEPSASGTIVGKLPNGANGVRNGGSWLPVEFCYLQGHGAPSWAAQSARGGSKTANESWTVPAAMKLLQPGRLYELRVRVKALLKAPDGAVREDAAASAEVSQRIRALGPPMAPGALDALVASKSPSNGQRPVFTGYDLRVRFVEDYVPFLYASVGQKLCLRLFDGQGRPVKSEDGNELLLPASEVGPASRSATERYWHRIYSANAERGCTGAPPDLKEEGLTVLRLGASLSPNSKYKAWLVSDGAPDLPLHEWVFTTSSYRTFADLVSSDAVVRRAVSARGVPMGDFEAQARSLGLPTIRYVDRMTVTPILEDGGRCLGALLEAPEPLNASDRLSARIDGRSCDLESSVDSTRIFAWVAGAALGPSGAYSLELIWKRDPGSPDDRLTLDGDPGAETARFLLPALEGDDA